jgi:hypothetical protein
MDEDIDPDDPKGTAFDVHTLCRLPLLLSANTQTTTWSIS